MSVTGRFLKCLLTIDLLTIDLIDLLTIDLIDLLTIDLPR